MKTITRHASLNLALASTALAVSFVVCHPVASHAIELEGIEVVIGQATWGDGGCPNHSQTFPSPDLLPVMRHKCEEVHVGAGGANNYSVPPKPCQAQVQYPSFSFDDNGTGAKVTVLTNYPGHIEWSVSEPKHSGSLTFHCRLGGAHCNTDDQCNY